MSNQLRTPMVCEINCLPICIYTCMCIHVRRALMRQRMPGIWTHLFTHVVFEINYSHIWYLKSTIRTHDIWNQLFKHMASEINYSHPWYLKSTADTCAYTPIRVYMYAGISRGSVRQVFEIIYLHMAGEINSLPICIYTYMCIHVRRDLAR